MPTCLLCTVQPATKLVSCCGYRLPTCSAQCAHLLHDLLLPVQPIAVNGGADAKRKPAEEEEDDNDDEKSSQKSKKTRGPDTPLGSPLKKLTELLVTRLQQTNDPDAAERVRHASTLLLQAEPPSFAPAGDNSHGGGAVAADWEQMPSEVRLMILAGLPILQVLRLGGLSREMHQISQDESLWRHFCRGPLARVFGTPSDRLCLRTWREQGLVLLQSKSYVVWRPHDPLRPVMYVPHPDEARDQPLMEIHDGEQGAVDRLVVNWPWIQLFGDHAYVEFGPDGRWFRVSAASTANDRVEATRMPLHWKPPSTARPWRYSGEGVLSAAAMGPDVSCRTVHVGKTTGIRTFHFEAQAPTDTPYRARMTIGLDTEADFTLRIASPQQHNLRAVRVLFMVPPVQALLRLPRLGPGSTKEQIQEWMDASTETLLSWQLFVGQRSNAWRDSYPIHTTSKAYDVLVLRAALTPTAPDYYRSIWTFRRQATIVENTGTPLPPPVEAVLQQQTLRVELDFSHRLLEFVSSPPPLTPTLDYVKHLVEHQHLSEDQADYLWHYVPRARVVVGLAVCYSPGRRMMIIPTDDDAVFDSRHRALQLTHGREGIAEKIHSMSRC